MAAAKAEPDVQVPPDVDAEILKNGTEEQYALPGKSGTVKQVVYFLAEFADQTPTAQPEEVAKVYVLPYGKAMKTLTFPEARRILTEADQFLRK